jgi:hypothetical protein
MARMTHAQRLQRIREFQRGSLPADRGMDLLREAFEGLSPAESLSLLEESGLQLQQRGLRDGRPDAGSGEGESLHSVLPFPFIGGSGSDSGRPMTRQDMPAVVLSLLLLAGVCFLIWLFGRMGCHMPTLK